LQIANIRIN